MHHDKSIKDSQSGSNLLVAVRVRPLTDQEKQVHIEKSVHVLDKNWLVLYDKGYSQQNNEWIRQRVKDKHYEFDVVLQESSTQIEVFLETCEFLIEGTLNGYNSSVFAYGPTGSGKSYTMIGEPLNPGLVYQTFLAIYEDLEKLTKEKEFKVSIGFLEIYNENIRDLLNPAREGLEIREDPSKGVTVSGLTDRIVASIDDVADIIDQGTRRRVTESTKANKVSSRSHAVLIITIEARERLQSENNEILLGKLSLIDLAGSERAARTKNKGLRLLEGANINRSLLSLGNCINALADLATKNLRVHVPYRDSKLTRLLKDSLGGNCRTVMISCISPAFYNYEDTLNTLAYATRAKCIKSKIRKNSINVQEHISKYTEIINRLKGEVKNLKEELGKNLNTGPKIDNFLIIINEHFKEEAGVRKEIYEGQEKIASLGFRLFDLQTQLLKGSHGKGENQTIAEIERLRKQIAVYEEEEVEMRKKIKNLMSLRKEMEENWTESGVDSSGLAALRLEVKKHSILMNSLDIKGIETSNKLVIEQKDMYIKFLEDQLKLRDFMISKDLAKYDEKTLKSYKSYEEISSFFIPSSLSSPNKDSTRSSLPSISKSRIPRLSESPKRNSSSVKRIKIELNRNPREPHARFAHDEPKHSRIELKSDNENSGSRKQFKLKKGNKETSYSQKYGRMRIMSVEPETSAASTNLTLTEKKAKPITITEKYSKSPFVKNWKINLSPKDRLK